MFCVSKGLGAPVGSLLCGRSRRHRRGPGAAAALRRRHAPGRGASRPPGSWRSRTMVERLADDHARARRLADGARRAVPRLRSIPRRCAPTSSAPAPTGCPTTFLDRSTPRASGPARSTPRRPLRHAQGRRRRRHRPASPLDALARGRRVRRSRSPTRRTDHAPCADHRMLDRVRPRRRGRAHQAGFRGRSRPRAGPRRSRISTSRQRSRSMSTPTTRSRPRSPRPGRSTCS